MILKHPIPDRMKHLPIESRGYPVPFFVAWIDGKPDFRVIEHGRVLECIRYEKCWLCGGRLGANKTFVVGPMCAINRVSSEPPSHRDCALFAAKTCPFLTMPKAQRRESNLPEHAQAAGGISIPRNPGVALVWTTRTAKIFDAGGILFDVGEPIETIWLAEGREATRAEVMASIDSGCPSLERLAALDGEAGIAALAAAKARAMTLLPTEPGSEG